VPSQTSSEERLCTCGKVVERPYIICAECRRKTEQDRHEKEKIEAEESLKEVSEDLETEWILKKSNIPSKFYDKTFENFESKLQPKALQSVKNLQWQWGEDADLPPKSMVLLSPGVYGVGKTHLVSALFNHIIATEEKAYLDKYLHINRRFCPVYFTSENELLRRIRNTYNQEHSETEEDIYKFLISITLLAIDDVGKVRPRDLNFLQGVYFNIIDQRYNDSLPVILTTNLDLSGLEAHIGGACADRLREMCGKNGFIKMSGESYRRK